MSDDLLRRPVHKSCLYHDPSYHRERMRDHRIDRERRLIRLGELWSECRKKSTLRSSGVPEEKAGGQDVGGWPGRCHASNSTSQDSECARSAAVGLDCGLTMTSEADKKGPSG